MGGGPLLLSSPLVLRFSQHCFFTIMHGTAERIFPLTGGAVLEPYLLHTTGAVKLREHPPKRISRLVMEHSKRCLYRAIASPLLHEWRRVMQILVSSNCFFFFFWGGEIIGEGILLLILGYVLFRYYNDSKNFFSDTVQIFESKISFRSLKIY